MEVVQPVTDTLATTWPGLVQHIFDKAWPILSAALTGFVSGWLLMHKPRFMQRGKPQEPG
jgi:ABC-type proline/glycine betaine transport system permease subunit